MSESKKTCHAKVLKQSGKANEEDKTVCSQAEQLIFIPEDIIEEPEEPEEPFALSSLDSDEIRTEVIDRAKNDESITADLGKIKRNYLAIVRFYTVFRWRL
ncbi:hypothetical protein MHK_004454 [Candidatus Magnetomorum sp. HK-1]|nr:hypothetical protein MHK_004454 [Candidatus Magnetomorum sp. HK-1]